MSAPARCRRPRPALLQTLGVVSPRLLVATAADAVGTGAFAPVMTLFYVQYRGIPMLEVATAMSIGGVAGLLAPFVVGPLQHRFGAAAVYRAACVTAFVGYLLALGVGSLITAAAVISLIRVSNRSLRPSLSALIWAAEPDGAVRSSAALRSIRNLGFGVAGLVGGLVLTVLGTPGYPVLLLVNAASYLVALVAIGIGRPRLATARAPVTLPGPVPVPKADAEPVQDPERATVGPGPPVGVSWLVAIGTWNGVLSLNRSALTVGVPLVVAAAGLSPGAVGPLFALNTVLVVLLQVRFAGASGLQAGARMLGLSGLLLAAAFVLYALATAVTMMPMPLALGLVVTAVLVHTVSEMYYSAGEFAAMFATCRDDGRRLNAWSGLASVQDVVGPLLITVAVRGSPTGLVLLGVALGVVVLVGKTAWRGAEARA